LLTNVSLKYCNGKHILFTVSITNLINLENTLHLCGFCQIPPLWVFGCFFFW